MNSKFRGALLGVLIGDCCGAAFEGEVFDAGTRLVLNKFLKKLDEPYPGPRLKYTDDTAMTNSVAKCLLKYDASCYQKDLAVNFVREFFAEPNRGYGAGVQNVFHKLRQNKFEDLLTPANQQFNCSGSFGNGAAMRISPVALYCLNKPQAFLVDLVTKTSVVTHSNSVGVNGAILQALAILKNLKTEQGEGNLDVIEYVDDLMEKFKKIETGQDEHGIPEEKYFTNQLKAMKKLLQKKFLPSDEEVINTLGHSVNALYSVPTAIYCFLRNSQLNDQNLKQTLEYTISLGGDTDTIGSMACALAGAFYGDGGISETLIKHCESFEDVVKLADEMFALASQ